MIEKKKKKMMVRLKHPLPKYFKEFFILMVAGIILVFIDSALFVIEALTNKDGGAFPVLSMVGIMLMLTAFFLVVNN